MTTLSGKTALVTGASRGIGRASALALAAAGAQVLVHYGRGAHEADRVVDEIRKAGGRGDAVAADLERADGPRKLAKLARDIVGDRLDILVANAGVSKSAPSKIPPLRTSIGCSPSTFVPPSFSSSNCFRSSRKEAVSFLSRRSRHAALSGRSQPMQQLRAPLTRW
jgi:NAD(P)-dependent dehydrogenase (short-subunit alcohol dehydrogenase family)